MKKIISVFTVLLLVVATALKCHAQISVGVSINIAPPALPMYSQPPCPVDGYLWVPGYWAYDPDNGYYWVPGVWVRPPHFGYLWTPGYWGYDGAVYVFHEGYWGRHIGFYGGVNYGFGYVGTGYVGGRWAGNSFQYNTAVVNVNTTVVHNTYVNKTVINNVTVNNNSFNGPGGTTAKPNTQERSAANENHLQATTEQVNHRQVAARDKSQFANVNNGRPTTTAMNKVDGNRFNADGNQRQRAARTDANNPTPDNKRADGVNLAASSNNQRDQQATNRSNAADRQNQRTVRPRAMPQHRQAPANRREQQHRERR